MLHRHLHVDYGAHDRGQKRIDERRREVLGDGDLQGRIVRRLHQLVDIVLGPAELGEQEDRRLFELYHPLKGEGRILGRHRIAGGEFHPRAHFENEGLAVVAHRRTLGGTTHELGDVFRLEAHDAIIGIGDHLDARKFVGFGRVERNDVVDVLGNNQRILRRVG